MFNAVNKCRRSPLLFLLSCFFALAGNAQEAPDGVALAPGYGYLLIRLICPDGEQVAELEFTNVDTKDVVTTRADMYEPAGQKARMGLIAMPEGRYYWSSYEPTYGVGLERPRFNDRVSRNGPGSAEDTFEIVPGAINYAGDWVMRFLNLKQRPGISLDASTIQRAAERFPAHVTRYEVYLSMMGKQAISLADFLKLVEEHSDQEPE